MPCFPSVLTSLPTLACKVVDKLIARVCHEIASTKFIVIRLLSGFFRLIYSNVSYNLVNFDKTPIMRLSYMFLSLNFPTWEECLIRHTFHDYWLIGIFLFHTVIGWHDSRSNINDYSLSLLLAQICSGNDGSKAWRV